MTSKADQIRAQIERLQAELEALNHKPEEPDTIPAAVIFEKTWGRNGKTYQYSAVSNAVGWEVVGQDRRVRTPAGPVEWDELIEFIDESEKTPPEIFVWTGLTQVER